MSDETVQDSDVEVQTPEFAPLQASDAPVAGGPMDRFYDVDVTIWAELGRVKMSLRELMQLGVNSVVKLGRSVSAPVELMAQGVRFATGEVVVVDDCFAIRIKEIESSRRSDG